MMEKPNDSNYNRTFNFGESSDVKLSPKLKRNAILSARTPINPSRKIQTNWGT